MKPIGLETVFEDCLRRMQKGEALEVILADYPAQAGQLRPLLLAAAELGTLRTPAVPAVIRNARRAQFLSAAAGKRQHPIRRLGWQPIRALVTSLVLLVIIGASLLGTGWVSAQALPGDTLYPVKRVVENTRLAFSSTSLDRLKLEESFDQQRTMEAARLVESQRSQEVSFHGQLEQAADGSWQVGGLTVYPKDTEPSWDGLSGTQVEVTGRTRPDGVQVEELRLRLFHLGGEIEQVGSTEWLVSGVPLDVSPATRILGEALTGSPVTITAVQLQAGRFLALSIQVGSTQVQTVKKAEETIHLSDWATLSVEQKTEHSGGDDSSGSGKGSSGSSSDDSQKTPEPEKTKDSN
jgi:hypothetical protein